MLGKLAKGFGLLSPNKLVGAGIKHTIQAGKNVGLHALSGSSVTVSNKLKAMGVAAAGTLGSTAIFNTYQNTMQRQRNLKSRTRHNRFM
jgi:hypothetical protein